MIGKASDVFIGHIAAKRVEHQERIEPLLQILRQHPREAHARTVLRVDALDQPLHTAWPRVCRRHATW